MQTMTNTAETKPVKASTIRQRRRRERMKAEGTYVEVTLKVPADVAAQLKILADKLCADHDAEVGPMRSTTTGKLLRFHA